MGSTANEDRCLINLEIKKNSLEKKTQKAGGGQNKERTKITRYTKIAQ